MDAVDVVVVGSGNAGLSAAIAAAENGASVHLVERAPRSWAGGNSYFTAGAYRASYQSLDDLRPLLSGLSDQDAARVLLDPYPPESFYDDLVRITRGQTDQQLARTVAQESAEAAGWLAGHGVGWELMFHRQSFQVGDHAKFWGNLTIGSVGGGVGLIEAEMRAASGLGVEVSFDTSLVGFHHEDGAIAGVVAMRPGGEHLTIRGRSVVLASGGFEADPRRRASHLGAGWEMAKVRGTPYNTGDGIFLALAEGAQPSGHWSGCHSIAWDAAAPAYGDRSVGNRFSRQAYPYGLVVNRFGQRFLDEGADFRNYTYAKYGARILQQPDAIAYQLFDQTTMHLLSAVDYDTAGPASRTEAGSIKQLAEALDISAEALGHTVGTFNRAVQDVPFDPTVLDARGTIGINPPKSNWANRLEAPPFVAFAVTCGITFTFGGVAIDVDGRVLKADGRAIRGLFAAGEAAGGLFYDNYPGGSGLSAGAVIGRRAGARAAAYAHGAGRLVAI